MEIIAEAKYKNYRYKAMKHFAEYEIPGLMAEGNGRRGRAEWKAKVAIQ